jgi:hypothetical protein
MFQMDTSRVPANHSTETVLLKVKEQAINNNAIIAFHVQMDKFSALPQALVLLNKLSHNAFATNNITLQLTSVIIVDQANSQEEMPLMDIRKVDAVFTQQTVLPLANRPYHNNFAMHANHAQMEQHSQTDHAEPQDQHAIVTKNTTLTLTHVLHAKLVNFHKMELVVNKTVDVHHINKTVLLKVNSNWANNNVMDANHANKEHHS